MFRGAHYLFPTALAVLVASTGAATQDEMMLRANDPPPNGVWIDSLDLSQSTIRRPRARQGEPPPAPLVFSLGGVTYPHAVPLLVNGELVIDLNGQATRFLSMVGVDDASKAGQGSVVFGVWVDGKKVTDSGVMKSGDVPKIISADVTGAKRMILAVSDAGDGQRDDSADWGGALLIMAPGASQRPQIATVPREAAPPIASSRTSGPRINSPRITGATPGRPFLFRIPASGEGPLTFVAKDLPAGLSLDSRTGIVTGALKEAGRTPVEVTVTGPKGKTSAVITIVGGDDALALTPPLGWNSWNVWGGSVTAEHVRAAADGMIKSGLAAQGYTYINIDDAWEGPRTADGEITTNEKFPDMKGLADSVHSLGLKIGIYSSPGPRTCQQKYAGSYQHEEQDARTYAKWGFDYLKYDWCSYTSVVLPPNPPPSTAAGQTRVAPPANPSALPREELMKPYALMRDILKKLDRDIVFSLCQYGWGSVWEWGNEVGGHLWRMTGDITDTWLSMSNIGFAQTGREKYAGPGGWNDTDMLVVGKVGWGRELRDTRLTPNEQLTHISLWTLQAAPMLIGADMSQIDQFTIDLLGNPEVIAVNQDPLGRAAGRVTGDGWVEVWARPLSDGTMAVGLFNRSPEATKVTAKWMDIGVSGPQPVRDLWLHKDLGTAADGFSATVPRHGVVLLKVGRPKPATDGK